MTIDKIKKDIATAKSYTDPSGGRNTKYITTAKYYTDPSEGRGAKKQPSKTHRSQSHSLQTASQHSRLPSSDLGSRQSHP